MLLPYDEMDGYHKYFCTISDIISECLRHYDLKTKFITLTKTAKGILYSIDLEFCLFYQKNFLVVSTSEEIRFETSSYSTLNCYFHERQRKKL